MSDIQPLCGSVVERGVGGLAHPLRHPAEAAPPFAVFEGWELGTGGLAHPLRHLVEAAPPFAVFEGWELGISGAKLLQKDRSIRVQGNEIIYLTLGPWTKPVQILVKPPAHLVFG